MHLKIEQIETALKRNKGFISKAAEDLGVTYHAIYKRIRNSEKLQKVREEATESFLDLAEFQLLRAVDRGESWAICFLLKCKGKDRGYIEKQQQEITGKAGGPLKVEVVGVDPDRSDED